MFDCEFDFFIANQTELVKKYEGKYLVLVHENVVGAYDTALEAYLNAKSKYKPGGFMIQHCIPGPSAYTVTINSTGVAGY